MKGIFSIIISFAILFTSMGFTFSSHYCGGEKQKSAFNIGVTDVSCGMETKSNTSSKLKSNCCKDEYQKIQIDDDYTQQNVKIDLHPNFIVAFVATYFNLFENNAVQKKYALYNPPPLIRDIPIMVQSFLI